MKRIAFVITWLSISCTLAQAQQQFFVFLQADNQQPFYVRLNEKTYGSSAVGHLTIPQLKDSTYHLTIGFPKNQYPEQDFVVAFNNKDLDLELKKASEGGWVLLNAQTAERLKPRLDNASGGNTAIGLGERKSGAFAILMAGLVNDSSVLYKSLVKTVPPPAAAATTADAPVPKETVQPGVTASASQPAPVAGAVPAATTPLETTVSKDSAAAPPATNMPSVPTIPSVVVQVQEWWNDKGKGYIFYDSTNAGTDTISIMIDFDKNGGVSAKTAEIIAAPAKVDSVKTAIAQPDTAVAQKEQPKEKEAAKAVAIQAGADTPAVTAAPPANMPAPPVNATALPAKDSTPVLTAKNTPDTAHQTGEPPIAAAQPARDTAMAETTGAANTETKKSLLLMNSDCVNFATENDVDKLRVKMLNAGNAEAKIAAAKKIFKTKCFVTRYIRGLSELFPNDEEKFNFFDAAYPFVSDSGNFRSLLDLFSDDLYIARFKALVRM